MRIGDLSLEELGGLVCQTLSKHGIEAVLSGGSCVSVWTANEYSSNDMDMITVTLNSQYQLSKALETLGFQRRGKGRYYDHSDTEFVLEFPAGPVMVGDEQVPYDRIHHLKTKVGTLHLLGPTDCIKDRLAAFYHWQDRQSWEQAVSLGRRHTPDWTDLKNWHVTEGESAHFDKFREAVEA